MPSVWIVEDETRIADVLQAYLAQAGFAVRWFGEGTDVVEKARTQPPDLMLLDLMLPGVDGVTICREIRRFSALPIIMLTARSEEIDRLLGLELGADDYICKPFSPREVVARVKAVLRRAPPSTPMPATGPRLHWQGLHARLDCYEASLEQQPIPLTPREFNLLCVMMRHPGRVFSREQLMTHLYHEEESISDRAIDTHIKNLRRKITEAGQQQGLTEREYIQSIYGVGYKLV